MPPGGSEARTARLGVNWRRGWDTNNRLISLIFNIRNSRSIELCHLPCPKFIGLIRMNMDKSGQPIDRPAPAARDPEHEITLIRPLVALQVRQNAPARTNPKPIYPYTSAWGPRVPALEGFVRKRPKPFTGSVIPSPHPKCLVLT
jgi:hypothetical protein